MGLKISLFWRSHVCKVLLHLFHGLIDIKYIIVLLDAKRVVNAERKF